MKYNIILIFLFLLSCNKNYYNTKVKTTYNSKGFAFIYNESDFDNKLIKYKFNNENLEASHKSLKAGSYIKLINPKNNKSLILQNKRKVDYPLLYKVLITKPVSKELELNENLPFVEIIEVKKNKSFIAKKTKIYKEEEKIHSNAPVESVKIDNISKNKSKKKSIKKKSNEKIYIVLGDFYSKTSAETLIKRINKNLSNFDGKKLSIKMKNRNKIRLLSGPYRSINLMKNDYIQLKNFGFEELDITINE